MGVVVHGFNVSTLEPTVGMTLSVKLTWTTIKFHESQA